jgi:putative ABC transport system permease protein
MFSVRWLKVLRDLSTNKLRTGLAILAIAIGIFGMGSILSAYAILHREIQVNFLGTNPASAILYIDGADPALARAVASLPDVAAAEPRRTISARFLIGPDEWRPLLLYVIDDFSALQVATFTKDSGAWPQASDELVIERSSLIDHQPGETLAIRTPNGQTQALRISGIVHDAAQAPGWQDRVAYGYISLAALKRLGETPDFNELRIVVADQATDVPHITEVAYQVKAFVEQRGYSVSQVYVPKPGEHPHTDQMDSLLFLFEAFGILALILSAILEASIVSALLAQQIRQIGAMKAIGARTRQIGGLYFGTVLIYALTALLIGIPLGQWAGRGYAAFTGEMLNFDLTSAAIPSWVYLVQIGVGLAVPLLAAAYPVLRGSRITIRQAISDYGLGDASFGGGFIDSLAARVRGLSRPLLLSLRNTFRRKARLLLTIGILAAGGATFMSALNVGASWSRTLDAALQARNYDLEVRFAQAYPTAKVTDLLQSVPGLVKAEAWQQFLAVQARAGGTDGVRFYVTGLPPATSLVAFPLLEGRWLRPEDTNAVVINHELLLDPEANIHLGDSITLKFGEQSSAWTVVGVIREVGAPRRGLGTAASAYVNVNSLAEVTGTQGLTTNMRIQTSGHDEAFVTAVTQTLEQRFDTAGLRRITLQLTTERVRVLQGHLVVILAFLMVMAGLVVLVGGLALASTTSINILERTREFGILRAVGASSGAILRIVMAEGLLTGALSWLAAVALAGPLSIGVGDAAGQIFLRTSLEHVFPLYAPLAWLGMVVVISLVASYLPARGAARLTVREVLAYG